MASISSSRPDIAELVLSILDRQLAGAIDVERMSQEYAHAHEGQQGRYDLSHRRLPWVTAMPTMAPLRKWR
jgi:hypothetical protein